MWSLPSSLSVRFFRISWNLDRLKTSQQDWTHSRRNTQLLLVWMWRCTSIYYFAHSIITIVGDIWNLLCKGAEWVAEGLCGQVEERLQEDVNLQRVETLTLVWKKTSRWTEARQTWWYLGRSKIKSWLRTTKCHPDSLRCTCVIHPPGAVGAKFCSII